MIQVPEFYVSWIKTKPEITITIYAATGQDNTQHSNKKEYTEIIMDKRDNEVFKK